MTIVTFEEGDESPKIRYTDNGDGSYTPIVDVGATITVSGGGLTDGELRASPISVISPNVDSDSVLSGQITVAAAGTAVQGTNIALSNGVYVKALAGNTGKGYVGNDGALDARPTRAHKINNLSKVTMTQFCREKSLNNFRKELKG